MANNLLKNKKGLIVGVANERSLAWGIAKSIFQSGGSLAFTYQNDALKKRIIPLAEKVDSKFVYKFDVQNYEEAPSFNDLNEFLKEKNYKLCEINPLDRTYHVNLSNDL